MFALIFFLAFASTVFAAGLWVAVWIFNLSYARRQSATGHSTEGDEFAIAMDAGETPQDTDAGPYAAPATYAAPPVSAAGIPTPTFINCMLFGIIAAILHAAIEVVIALSFGPIWGGRNASAQVALALWLHPWVLFGLGFLLGTVLLRYILVTTFRRALVTSLIMYILFLAVAGLLLGPLLLFSI